MALSDPASTYTCGENGLACPRRSWSPSPYGDLLDYVISAALFFYILTVAGVVVLRWRRPALERPYRTPFYPWLPVLYLLLASCIFLCLAVYRPAATWPGFGIVAAGAPVYYLFRWRANRHRARAEAAPETA